MVAKPDYASLVYKGNGMKDDSLARALCAAGTLLGRQADYTTVTCLLSNPFAPGIDLGEDCLSHWCVEAGMGDRVMAQAAGAVGLRAVKLDLPAFAGDKQNADDAKRHRAALARVVRPAMDEGQVVITTGGWDYKGPHGFTHWAWAGLITEAREDGTMLGAHLNGHKDNPVIYDAALWAISPCEATLTPAAADAAMLQNAADRICGKGAFARTERNVYGLEAMDAWIARMEQDEGFCKPCQSREKNGWGDAVNNAERMYAGARTVVQYLTARLAGLPLAAQPNVRSAIRHYQRIADLLKLGLTGEGGEKLQQFVGDLQKQQAHAQTVLRPVRKELADAASELTAGVAAIEVLPGQVRPEAVLRLAQEDTIGVEAPYLGAGVPRAIVAALRHSGTSIDFNEFVAMTGWAFSFGYKYDNWHTAGMAVCGRPGSDGPHEIFRWLPERLGYTFEGIPIKSEPAKLAEFVKANVDAGRPVIGEHFDGGVIAGYRQKAGVFQAWYEAPVGRGWLAQNDFQPTWVYVLKRTGEPTPRRQLYREALARAVTKASAHEFDKTPQGIAALETYRRDVADPSKTFDKASEWFCWAAFERLMARRCCAMWLKVAAGELGGPARQHLLSAAEQYGKAFDAYNRYRECVAEGDGTGLTLQQRWRTPERIARLLPLLDEGIAAEKAGIEAMKAAVAAGA